MKTMTFNVHEYLRRFQLGLMPDWSMADPLELIDLAQCYASCGDCRSVLGCIYLYTSLKHPSLPEGCPTTVELGREVLEAWLDARRSYCVMRARDQALSNPPLNVSLRRS